jgi:HAD superfamily hydrolase (TIGR01549 family)
MAAFLFDLDGTLADSRQCLLNSVDYSLESIGLKGLNYDRLKATQQDLATTLKTSLSVHGLDPDERQVKEFIHYFREFHEAQEESCISLYSGIPEILESLKPHFRLGVATTKDSVQAIRVIKRLGIFHFFDHIQGTDPGMRYKPAPDILLKSLEILEKSPQRSFYLGDSGHDMKAAKAGGLRALAAAYGFAGDQGFDEHEPDWKIHSPLDLISLRSELLDVIQSEASS